MDGPPVASPAAGRIPTANSEADAIRQLEERKFQRAEGTRQEGLFELKVGRSVSLLYSNKASSMGIQMNLGAFLQRRPASARYRLVKATEGRLAAATVYGLASRPARRIDLVTVWHGAGRAERTYRHAQSRISGCAGPGQYDRGAAPCRGPRPDCCPTSWGTSAPLPEGEWSVPDQLAELPEYEL